MLSIAETASKHDESQHRRTGTLRVIRSHRPGNRASYGFGARMFDDVTA